jgi:hypothetical protein
MSVNSYSSAELFFIPYGYTKLPSELYLGDAEGYLKGLSVVGYLPVIGTISGLFRIKMAISIFDDGPDPLGSKTFRASMILRGVVETLSIGAPLLIVDAVVAATRGILSYTKNSTKQQAIALPHQE